MDIHGYSSYFMVLYDTLQHFPAEPPPSQGTQGTAYGARLLVKDSTYRTDFRHGMPKEVDSAWVFLQECLVTVSDSVHVYIIIVYSNYDI
jgi:hypothetical protein